MNTPHRPPAQQPAAQPVALPPPRSQVGIERLPTRHTATEARESMNCKSCRKRKIKCNRLRPACEACQVFQCPCIYDAVPKKRGPKTDVLEALLKRVDGLEAKLKEKNSESDRSPSPAAAESSSSSLLSKAEPKTEEPVAKRLATQDKTSPALQQPLPVYSLHAPAVAQPSTPPVQTDALLDTYFARFHTKPYHLLDESSVRKRMQLNQLPSYLFDAIAAVAARHTPHPNGYRAAAGLSEEYAACSRSSIDIDEPSIDALQAILLLVTAYLAAGRGMKAYMLLTNAIGMIMALELHREMDARARVTPAEREVRRRLFWSCYLLDRYAASGSKRTSLISDDSILLRLPSWSANPSTLPIDGELFLCGSNLQYFQGSGKTPQGSSGMLIDITRILGVTNRYLAAGGVKGDSHFPWHSLSNLSKIRQDLDVWTSGTDKIFSSPDSLFGQVDTATTLVLCKLIYHLIHCLLYRPFLPISLAELAGNGQHQSWQIEATNMCFLHANAIAELIEVSRHSNAVEWPSFVGYCICTAGTVHIHGAHYSKQGANGEMNVFSSSAEFLSREMQQLSELRYTWAIVHYQRDMLQRLYDAHGELLKTLTENAMRYTPGFQLEDFFDRYADIGGPGGVSFHFDTANLSLSDEKVDFSAEPPPPPMPEPAWGAEGRPNLKRKNTAQPSHDLPEVKPLGGPPPQMPTLSAATYPRQSMTMHHSMMPPHSSTGVGTMPALLPPHMEGQQQQQHMGPMRSTLDITTGENAPVPGFGLSHGAQSAPGGMASLTGLSFNPTYSYNLGSMATSSGPPTINDASGGFDAMFGTMPINAYDSPAGWQGDPHRNMMGQTAPGAAAPSPSTKSNTGSTGTGVDERDPFMSLLEQLANDEQRQNNGLKSEVDFFLTGTDGLS